jgi:galactokinase
MVQGRASLQQRFEEWTGRPARVFSAPGRVNLIGEHTDYNDGYVLPIAINRRTYVAGSLRDDGRIRCRSTGYAEEIEFELSPSCQAEKDWANPIRGVATCLLGDQYQIGGADLWIESEVPIGAGLSSSAAVEVATALALLALAEAPVDPVDIALLSQRAEQLFMGTNCGVMDQYVASLGVAGHALLIDCRSLEYRAVPLNLSSMRVVICNSMVQHELATGEYNQRRKECEEGVRRLSAYLPGILALRDVEIEAFDLYSGSLPSIIARRCNHVLTENARTLEAVTALEACDWERLGRLMNASHESLRDDYAVSCPELDLLVEIAQTCPGVYGARMTGGGFGGSTVQLVRAENVDLLCQTLIERYQVETGRLAECFVCQAGEGMREEV